MDEKTQRISLRAYELWENEGRPHGRDAEHWIEAEQQVAAELNSRPAATEAAATEAAAVPPAAAPAAAGPAAVKPARSSKTRR